MPALSSQKEEYVESGQALSAEVLQSLPSYAYAQCCMVHISYILKDLSGLLPALSSRGGFRREGATNRGPSFFGPQTCMVMYRRRPPHLCLSFCSNSSSLLQTASCDASVAGRTWVPKRVSMLSKLLHEGKTAAIRVRSCGHHDSLQFFIPFSFWAENLFIAVTAFALNGRIYVVAA